MPIIVNVDVMLAKRKMSSGELAEKVGITRRTCLSSRQARQRLSASLPCPLSARLLTASREIFWSISQVMKKKTTNNRHSPI